MLKRTKHLTAQELIYFFTCFICLIIEWLVFVFMYAPVGNSVLITIVKGCGDCLMLLIVYWFIPSKLKWILLIIIWLLSFFFLFNAWHIEFWDDIIPVTFYRLFNNVNSDLLGSIKALLSISDLSFVIPPIIATIVYYNCYKISTKSHMYQFININKALMISITIILFIVSQSAFIVTNCKWNKDSEVGESSFLGIMNERLTNNILTSRYDFQREGLSFFIVRAFIEIISDLTTKHTIDIDSKGTASISSYIRNVPNFPVVSEFQENQDKNVIIIIVESLNSDVIGKKINDHEITPNLNKIINSTGTISSLNMIPQVKQGCSNDGQLLINTGLLPLDKGVSSMLFGDRITYPQLGKILNINNTIAIFGDSGNTWNQTRAFKSYGFNKIYRISDFEKRSKEIGRDLAMFEFTNSFFDNIKQPFLIELVTFSTHIPFSEKCVPIKQWLKTDSLSKNEMNYLNMINYFDSSLGYFIDQLNNNQIMGNTVLFIISDHSQGLGVDASKFKDNDNNRQDILPMAFIAMNTGITKKIDRKTGQVNVFPTILHIMNKFNKSYHGLGRSLLDDQLTSAVTTKYQIYGNRHSEDIKRQYRAYQISDSIQRSDYFRSN